MEIDSALDSFVEASKSDLATMLMAASRIVNTKALAKLDPDGSTGLRLAHLPVIAALDAGGVRMGEIAQRIGVTRQAAAALCKDLDAAGVVVCVPDPEDARATLVTLTPLGAALCERATVALRELERDFAGLVGHENLSTTLEVLQRIASERP